MRRVLVLAALALLPGTLAAQSSIFGIRGPGFPGRPYSARTVGTGGSFGLFDPESQLSPASLSAAPAASGTFTILSDYRSVTTPVGSSKTQDFRFPLFLIAVPIDRGRWTLGFGATTYANRDFTVATLDTILLRDQPVEISDTIRSRGGLSDLRIAAAWKPGRRTTFAGAFHLITGTDRLVAKRVFSDSNYVGVVQGTELSTTAIGVSAGVNHALTSRITLAAFVRKDFDATVNIDSAQYGGSTGVGGKYGLPLTVAGGVKARVRSNLEVALAAQYRTWSATDSFLVSFDAPGSSNTFEVTGGAELTAGGRRRSNFPLRIGGRYGTLPFKVDETTQPYEFAVSLGTGGRFARERAGIDMSLERVWRRGGEGRSETAWLLYTGINIRP